MLMKEDLMEPATKMRESRDDVTKTKHFTNWQNDNHNNQQMNIFKSIAFVILYIYI